MLLDANTIRQLAARGLTVGQMASELDEPYYRVRKSVQVLGLDVLHDARGRPAADAVRMPKPPKTPKPPRTNPNAERDQRMSLMYRQGLPLEKIGQTFGLTRERVRQILRKLGVSREEGGQAKVMRSKAQAEQAKQDARYLTRYGVTFAEFKEVRAAGLLLSYRRQECGARARGIEWGLNLAQWMEIWKTSGKLELRGRGIGKYVMSRIKDAGGYVVGNVHIQLSTDNNREAVEQWRGMPAKKSRGVYLLYPGLSKPYMAKVGKASLGLFATEEAAVAARVAYASANGLIFDESGRAVRSRLDAHSLSFVPDQPVKQQVSRFPTPKGIA